MKKRFLALLLEFAAVLSLTGCAGRKDNGGESTTGDQGSNSTMVATDFPVTLTDAAGREVTIEREPERLVSGYYITTSMLIALGQQDKLVGIEAKANTRPIYELAAPELLELPSVGTAKSFDLEGCAALQPDLVILPMKLKNVALELEKLGLTALTVDPESLEQLNDTVVLLGAAVGASERAQELLDYNGDTQAFLSKTLSGLEKPKVYLAGNSSYLSTAGRKMYQNTMLELGGGENVAAGLEDGYWAEVSYEQLLAWNPEVIVIASGAAYTKEELMDDPQLEGLAAVRDGRVYAMPSAVEAWDSPVPSAMVGSRWVAAVLHGQQYAFEQFQSDAAEFYQKFYQVSVDPSALGW